MPNKFQFECGVQWSPFILKDGFSFQKFQKIWGDLLYVLRAVHILMLTLSVGLG